MVPALSTKVLLPQRLTPALLKTLAGSGVRVLELFAARFHLDYTNRTQMREIAAWFQANDVAARLHAPVTADVAFSRHAAPNLNLVDAGKQNRIAAMEEIKRALECAEYIAIPTCVLHLGLAGSQSAGSQTAWSEYVLEYALTAIEHLNAFAAPLGVRLLLENLPNDVATPAHLLEILRVGHFDRCGLCFDIGHAHLSDEGVAKTFEEMRSKVGEVHLHDNDGVSLGMRDDAHRWPATGTERPAKVSKGTIDWESAYTMLQQLPADVAGVLEIADHQVDSAAMAARLASEVISEQRRKAGE